MPSDADTAPERDNVGAPTNGAVIVELSEARDPLDTFYLG